MQRDSNPQGHPCPSNFQDCVFIQPDYTLFFLPTVVNRGTFSQSRLKQFHKSPHDSYHDYKRNNFSNLAETIGVEPIQLFSCLRFSKPSHYRSGMLPNSRHGLIDLNYLIMYLQYIILSFYFCCMCLLTSYIGIEPMYPQGQCGVLTTVLIALYKALSLMR